MAKIAYFDCPTGIAGNMCLGALVDAGVPWEVVQGSLATLPLTEPYHAAVATVHRQGQRATYLKVHIDAHGEAGHAPHRHLPDIEAMICGAKLPERVQTWSLQVFRTLAIAEAAVHGIAPEAVHFHEVGATDAIVDIVGTCVGLDWLGIEQIFCSAWPTGGGTVRAAHGLLPVPVPAVLQLAAQRQVPLYDNGIHKELVTPTGAAIAVALSQGFGAPPPMTLERVGLGAGSHDLPLPNLLRLWLGEPLHASETPALEPIVVLETQVDDLSPQVVGYLYEELLRAGAVDVYTQAIGMKKSRPGILITVLCPTQHVNACEALLFQETTTLGIRRSMQQRTVLPRHIETLDTPLGAVRFKVARVGDRSLKVQPEYEDCAQLARRHQMPLQEVQRLALQQWQESTSKQGR